jgi:hypothetical protein
MKIPLSERSCCAGAPTPAVCLSNVNIDLVNYN